ncbi:hypothetical protein B1T45_10140 [Mycobacterium kansasii]|nr:hypothetical protein [Mycobacterium kansasii]AGZ54337.1 hypothetical protein MKAN_19130 [Mycobacterium kansasii ATCC 12478]EUA05712.1 hypothetical protein I547_1590 [Mycobacterium kansasii 824]ARG56147.1 hypothetical protein B1T43_10070 [Mycobacterium kansasii]ARG61592.1 hypothetical protein B1T45_10140 [Mycobacterium kansasii]ARG69277.1 hypothetical protein B1T47_09765 [Mycobacterium kansasii]
MAPVSLQQRRRMSRQPVRGEHTGDTVTGTSKTSFDPHRRKDHPTMPKPTRIARTDNTADDAESGSAQPKAGTGKSRRGRLAAGATLGALALTSGIAGIVDTSAATTANGLDVNVGRLTITLASHGGFKLDSCTSNTNDTSGSSLSGTSSNSNDTTATTQDSTTATSNSGGVNEPPTDIQTNVIPGDDQPAGPQVTSSTSAAGGYDEDYFSSSESDDDSSGTNTVAQWQANNNEYRPDDPNSEEQSDLDFATAYAAGDPYDADN